MNMGDGFSRSKGPRVSGLDIEALKSGLRQLVPTRAPTKIDVLRDLSEVVDEMLEGGVTYIDIAKFLTEKTGLKFAPGPIKSMLSKVRKEKQISMKQHERIGTLASHQDNSGEGSPSA